MLDADLANIFLMAGAIVLAFTIGRLLRREKPNQDGTDTASRLRETAERLQAELETAAREAQAQLETRIHILEELILRAERLAQKLGDAPGGDACGGRAPSGRHSDPHRPEERMR